MTRARRLLPALLLLTACATTPAAPPAPVTPPAPPPLPPRPEASTLSEEEAAFVADALADVESVRGLRFEAPVEVLEAGPEMVTWLVQRDLREQKAEGVWGAWVDMLRALALVPVDADVEAEMMALLEEQVRGLYDHRDQTLVVVKGAAPVDPESAAAAAAAGISERRMFLFHELMHALQDQRFGLGRYLDPSADEDRATALRALVEGDATYAMYDLSFTRLAGRHVWEVPDVLPAMAAEARRSPAQGRLASAPPYLAGSLLFPYLEGTLFVDRVFRAGGWEAVDALYDAPPTTTEQVLHPEKYLAGEGARAVALPDLLALGKAGYRAHPPGTLGELGLRLWLHTLSRSGEAAGMPALDPAGPGAGWGGDRYQVYVKPGVPPAVVWRVAFDTPVDRDGFLEAAADALSGHPGFRLARDGDLGVVVLGGLSEKLGDAVLEALGRD